MEHIITPEEVVSLGRPIGKVDDNKLLAFITEAEQMSIKPALGDELFLKILSEGETNEKYQTLLKGGEYRDCNSNLRSFVGLKVAISYYVYAQNIMSGDFTSTRFGMRIKDSEFSQGISSKERSDCYNNALEVAQHYLSECIAYCKSQNLFTTSGKRKVISTGGCTIRKIGN